MQLGNAGEVSRITWSVSEGKKQSFDKMMGAGPECVDDTECVDQGLPFS